MLLGSHIPTVGGVAKAIDRATGIDCTAMQIFVKNNMQWFANPFLEEEVKSFTQHPLRKKLGVVIAHAGYLINLGTENSENHEKSLRSLGEELLRCDQLDIPYLVLHPGSHLGAGVKNGIRCVVQSLNQIHAEHPKLNVRIALETTAGQGSCLGSRFEELAEILDRAKAPERLRICLDTAHVFAAGYDLSEQDGAEKVFKQFDNIIGLQQLCALHINESKAALGSRVDRHENLGQGKIGLDAFRWIMRSRTLEKIPKILETPKAKDLAEDVAAMKLLRSFKKI
ncbi:MAG: deoxyribonuclease IV [Verrucomicrobia bacterium]|nr:deoxyribonuclease IV [Verrucomicrobiota bacterium]